MKNQYTALLDVWLKISDENVVQWTYCRDVSPETTVGELMDWRKNRSGAFLIGELRITEKSNP